MPIMVGESWLEGGEDALRRLSEAGFRTAFRYTSMFDTDDYCSGIARVEAELFGTGFELIRTKNAWQKAEVDYRGINTRSFGPQSSTMLKLQFRTPEREHAAAGAHDACEQVNDPLTSTWQRVEWRTCQQEIFSPVPLPGGVEGIGDTRARSDE